MKIKNELRHSGKELGSFCAQYRYQDLFPKAKDNSRKWKKARGRKNPRKDIGENYKKESKPKKEFFRKHCDKKRHEKRAISYYKCGSKGQIASNCTIKETIEDLDSGPKLKA